MQLTNRSKSFFSIKLFDKILNTHKTVLGI
nr:MAG TPA: hypothetical protein [Caudoviricetes sp.]